MNIERITQMIARIVPGGVDALRQRELEEAQAQRSAEAQRHDAEHLRLTAELEVEDAAVAKAQADVDRKAEALAAANAKLSAALRRRLNVRATIDSQRRRFVATMRDASTMEFLESLAARVDALVLNAVPTVQHHTVYNRLRKPVEVMLSGDAGPRRVALWALRREIVQQWHLEPLSREDFEKKFEATIAKLPALIPPISVEEYVRRSNAA